MLYWAILVGRSRATYVKSYSGKNIKYDENTDMSKMSPEDRVKALAAMRSRRKRQRSKDALNLSTYVPSFPLDFFMSN